MILAQESAPQGGPAAANPLQSMIPLFLLMAVFFYFMMIRPQSKERKKREAMLSSIKKNDRVVTIGGIVGTVASVRDHEVTLKVDESSNTKITFSRSSISSITQGENGEKDAK